MSNKDLRSIGEKYMSSNFFDLGTLKSAPNKYGFCGQSLPNLINVSKTVKVTSRHEKSEETWMKLFEHGKEKQFKMCNIRPSKGTTNFNKDEENSIFQKNTPYYYIFIKCPYVDYSMANSPKQSSLEFKDWNQVTKLLDKLIQFSKGDMTLKKVNSIEKGNVSNKANKKNTREQVKKIIDKILGTCSKNPGVTHLHKGIKGKQIKRKVWKHSIAVAPNVIKLKENCNKPLPSINNIMDDIMIDISDDCKVNTNKPNKKRTIKKKENYVSLQQKRKKNALANIRKSCLESHISKAYNSKFKKVSKNNEEANTTNIQLQKKRLVKKTNKTKRLGFNKGGLVLRKFEMQTDSVKKRCNELEQRTRNLLNQLHKINYEQFVTKNNIQFRNVTNNNLNVSIQNQPTIINSNLKSKEFLSSYDLVKTILQSQPDSNEHMHIDYETNNSVAVGAKQTQYKTYKSIDNKTKVISSEPVITFQSHKYYADSNMNIENNTCHRGRHTILQNKKDIDHLNIYKNPRTFISKQSRENFIIPNTLHKHNNLKKKSNRTGHVKQLKSSVKRLFNQKSKYLNMKHQIMHNLGESSHTIEFTESSFHITNQKRFKNFIDSSRNHGSNTKEKINIQESWLQSADYNNCSVNNDHIAINTNTYTISNTSNNGYSIEEDNWNLYNTPNVDIGFDHNCLNHKNFIFISKSQEHEQNKEILNAMDVCETIFQSQEMFNKESGSDVNHRQHQNHNIIENTNFRIKEIDVNEQEITEDKGPIHYERTYNQDVLQEYSQYFDFLSNNIEIINLNVSKANDISKSPILTTTLQNLPQNTTEQRNDLQKIGEVENVKDSNEMYNNFLDDVRNNAEVFQPKIHEAKEFTTKAIDKVNSSLKFDGDSLKSAKVLGQIDKKFIAAIMKGGCYIEEMLDFFILFDQHAVHERIRLESNLSDYLSENQWKPVKIDAVTLKISQDDILYLHNYKLKFEQLGLKWTVVNTNEVSFDAIPEAILGKNLRPVDKVVKAVKNLITEEINVIKMQGGCVSLYPKSIMDLVFSEACRYAIKFGDKLPKSECIELLKMLSECKTPFQCAHGRPVMAVIMDVKLNIVEYKANFNKIMEWNRTNI